MIIKLIVSNIMRIKTILRKTIVNKDKRTCVAVYYCHVYTILPELEFDCVDLVERKSETKRLNVKKLWDGFDFTVTGIAKCHESDTFDEKRGLEIAEQKALIKAYNKAESIFKYETQKAQKIMNGYAKLTQDMYEKGHAAWVKLGKAMNVPMPD